MKHMKKSLALILSVIMVVTSLIGTTVLADNQEQENPGPHIVATVDKSEVNVGDTITLTVSTKKMDIATFIGGIYFNPEYVTFVEADNDSVIFKGKRDDTSKDYYQAISIEEGVNNNVAFKGGADRNATYEPQVNFVSLTFTAIKKGKITFGVYEKTDGPDSYKNADGTSDPGPQVNIIDPVASITATPKEGASVVYHVGDTFDKDTLTVTATLASGGTETVASTDFTVDKTGALTTEDTKVTVSYGGKTAEVDITVSNHNYNEAGVCKETKHDGNVCNAKKGDYVAFTVKKADETTVDVTRADVMAAASETTTAENPWGYTNEKGTSTYVGTFYSLKSILNAKGITDFSTIHGISATATDGFVNGYEPSEIDDIYVYEQSEVLKNGKAAGAEGTFGSGIAGTESAGNKWANSIATVEVATSHKWFEKVPKGESDLKCYHYCAICDAAEPSITISVEGGEPITVYECEIKAATSKTATTENPWGFTNKKGTNTYVGKFYSLKDVLAKKGITSLTGIHGISATATDGFVNGYTASEIDSIYIYDQGEVLKNGKAAGDAGTFGLAIEGTAAAGNKWANSVASVKVVNSCVMFEKMTGDPETLTCFHYCAICGKNEGLYAGKTADDITWNMVWDEESQAYTKATATYKAACGEEITVDATITGTKTDSAATCKTDGKTTYSLKFECASGTYTKKYQVTDFPKATGHTFGEPVWGKWNADHTSITAQFTCSVCGKTTREEGYIVEVTATKGGETNKVTSVEKSSATCTEDQVITYTASVVGPDGKTYTKSSDVTIVGTKTGHTYKVKFDWSGLNEGKGSVTAKGEIACEKGDFVVKTVDAVVTVEGQTAAKCGVAGSTEYKATIKYDGKTFTESQTDNTYPIALDHDYTGVTPVWNWNGTESAKVSFECKREGCDHIETVDAVVTSEITQKPKCTVEGITTYTAKATFGGKEYKDTKTTPIAATGHTYEAKFTWTGFTAEAEITCKNCDFKTTKAATVTSAVTKEATCTVAGNTLYTATVTYDGQTFTATKEDKTAPKATGHTYGEPTWTWDGFTKATATFTCTACTDEEGRVQTVEATGTAITSEVTTEPTCEKAGVTTYTAKVTFGGKEYTATKEDNTKPEALGHDYTDVTPTWSWKDDYSEAVATFACKRTGCTHTEKVAATIVKEITKEAVVNSDGSVTKGVAKYTATVKFKADGKTEKEFKETKEVEFTVSAKIETKKNVEVTEALKKAGIADEATLKANITAKSEEAAKAAQAANPAPTGYVYSELKTIVIEVELQVSLDDGKTFVKATAENFPKAGLKVTLPYPEGTDSSYEFDVTHMFSEGENAGKTENLAVTKTKEGLEVTVTALSPFAITYYKAEAQQGGGSVTPGVKTGDTNNMLLWILIAAACVAAAGGVVVYKKKKSN